MNNHNDFGLKKVDLNKRKLKKKNNFFIPLILVISVLTIVLFNNNQDLSFNNNIDNKSSKEFISSESPVVSDIVETNSLNNTIVTVLSDKIRNWYAPGVMLI